MMRMLRGHNRPAVPAAVRNETPAIGSTQILTQPWGLCQQRAAYWA